MNKKTTTLILLVVAVAASFFAVQTYAYQYNGIQEAWAFSERNSQLARIVEEIPDDGNPRGGGGGSGGGGGAGKKVPVISSINPSSGVWGTSVTLSGNNFAGNNEVTISDPTGESTSSVTLFLSSNGTIIQFSVPQNLQDGYQYGVMVDNQYGTSNGVAFDVLNPGRSTAVVKNGAFGNPSYAAGTTQVRIGSYRVSAPASEGVNLASVTIRTGASSSIFSNLRLLVGGAQFGVTYPTLINNTAYTFSGGTSLSIPAGSSKIVDMYADVLSGVSPATFLAPTTFLGCVGTAMVSLVATSCNSAVGQDVIVLGPPSITVSADPAQVPASHLVMGSVNNPLATFRFTETTNSEDVRISILNLTQGAINIPAALPTFSNLQFFQGSTSVGGGMLYASSSGGTGVVNYLHRFTFGSPIVVPRAGTVSLVLKGDVLPYGSLVATDGSRHDFDLRSSSSTIPTPGGVVIATGAVSNATSQVVLSGAHSNTMTALRSKLTVSATPLGALSNRTKTSADRLATITFSADPAGGTAVLNTLTITYAGSAATTTLPSTAGSSTRLLDASLVDVTTSLGAWSFTSGLKKTWIFTTGLQIAPGTSYTFTLELNSVAGTVVAGPTSSVTLNAKINGTNDVLYTTAPSGGTPYIGLPASVVPVQITTVTYAPGT